MVNMMLRPPYEGSSLYAKTVNALLLQQYPTQAHRNRICYLTQKLVEETVRVSLAQRPARIFSLGCGPAQELQAFMRQNPVSNLAEFTLLDFNQETINYTRSILEGIKRSHGRECLLQYQKKSVISLLKEASRNTGDSEPAVYDFVYCAGLFDYLPDRTCQQLMKILYQTLAPGGLLVATNVYPCQPFRYFAEYLMDWHLIYRNPRQMQLLVPPEVPAGQSQTVSDLTGTNLLLEIRKPLG
jgi:extracellular factor (EF) 3-hydroxypalmitic acid methyl ester biosynthesis protein